MECSYEECIKEEQAAGKGSCYDVWTVRKHRLKNTVFLYFKDLLMLLAQFI